MARIIDLTLGVHPQMRGVGFAQHTTIAEAGWNTTMLQLYSHAGTHMDAPRHFIDGGTTIDALALEACIGRALVIDLRKVPPRGSIDIEHMQPYVDKIGPGMRLLLHTGWGARAGQPDYRTHFPRVSLALARWLAERRIALLGVEPPSVADVNNKAEVTAVHRALLEAGIVIVEGLTNLGAIEQEQVFFVALPLKLQGIDGSPVRAIAIEGDMHTIQ